MRIAGVTGFIVGVLGMLVMTYEPAAHACTNVVAQSRDERISTLHEAEAALDEGDVLRARELAEKVDYNIRETDGMRGEARDDVVDHAERLLALSFVRDPDATDADRAHAVSVFEDARRRRSLSLPTLDADAAEALSRTADGHATAYVILEPLAKRDLIGSPNALGALVRVAKERGDEPTATLARARCEGMIGSSRVCAGDYPRPPLVRGTTRSYLAPAIVALLALALRLFRSRRVARHGRDEQGRPLAAPWIGHAALLQTLAIAGAALYVFARPSVPVWTTMVLGAALYFGLVAERRGFFASARRGKISGLVVRPAGPDDLHLPRVALFFGPKLEQALEQERGENAAEPGYREAARKPVLRIGRRRLPLPVSFALAAAIAVVAAFILFALFASLRG